MTRTLRLLIAAPVIVLTFAAGALADTVGEVVDQVSESQYTAYLWTDDFLYTNLGDDRGLTGPEHDPARTNIFDRFSGFGLSTTLESFTYSGTTYYNVVAVQEGAVHPDQIYIVGAHYDSVNNPGADDDASGVAGILEAARVLSQYEFESTLVFIAFDREEQGLKGSWAYAGDHSTDDIRGMVALDMIAYNPVGTHHDKAYVYWYQDNSPLTTDLQDALATYGHGLLGEIAHLSSASSDHAPFDANGFDAALLIEHAVWSNPHYHLSTDSVDTAGYIDYAYATDMTRGVVGYLATAAELYEVSQIPEPATVVLLGSGMVAVLLLVWRRRRTTAN